MLVLVSDLHLTDGTSGETINPRAFRIFRERLRDMAYEASWRLKDDSKRVYIPIDELHLILLGDILDVIRSTKWLDPNTVRPWNNPNDKAFISKIRQINNGILKNNVEALSTIKSLNSDQMVTLPPATQDGKPAQVGHEYNAEGRVPVKVHVHYMVGNHDWFYHLPGKDYNSIRKSVVDAMGLANDPNKPFPHDLAESDTLRKICADHRVFVRHGDIYDPFNYKGDRDASSLGDAIVVELLNRFPNEVTSKMAGVLPADCLNGLKEIDNVRPLPTIPVWVDGLLQRTCPDPKYRKQVKQIWDDLVDDFLKIDFLQQRDSGINPLDNVDLLEWGLKFSKGVSFGRLSDWIERFYSKIANDRSSFYKNVLQEQDFRNRQAQFIVYGHTHNPEIVPLDSTIDSDGVLNQMYLNSGTWRRVHELAQIHPSEQEFMGYYVMTHIGFFKGDERLGRPFEFWSGALG